jgi:hypothetical protein
MIRASRARRSRVQLRLDLVEVPAPPVAVWEGLTAEQQAAVVGLLARLIAKTLAAGEADDA